VELQEQVGAACGGVVGVAQTLLLCTCSLALLLLRHLGAVHSSIMRCGGGATADVDRWYATQCIPLFFIGGLVGFVVVDAVRVRPYDSFLRPPATSQACCTCDVPVGLSVPWKWERLRAWSLS
jgi:hypothetical protein